MEGVYCNKKPANAGNSRREEAMKYDLRAIQRTALLVAIAAAMTLSGAKARADVTLSAMFPYTKVDPEYQELQELYARFHQQNPDITINFDYLDHDAYHVKMQALAISNNLPNILTLWPGKRTGYITDRGYARDLEPWIKRDDLAAAQRAVFLTPQARGGQVYELGVPFVNFTNVVYVNKKLLDQLGLSFPKTLKDFEAQAPVIRKGGFRPVVFGDQSDWVLQSCLLSVLVSRIGGVEWFDKVRYGEGGHSFNDPQFVTALQTVRDMTDAGLIDQSEPQTTRQQALSAFVSGKSVYFIGGIWEVVNLDSALPADMKSQIEMHTFPHVDGGAMTDDASSSGEIATGFGISKASTDAQAEAAWKWIKFTLDANQADIYVKHGDLPVYQKGGEEIAGMITDPLLKSSYSFSTSTNTVLPVLDDKMDAQGVEQIINAGLQELVLGSTTAHDLAAKYERWVAANDSNRKQ
jgi:raffinose/stachyose/melibiose transport system substrate-binding protein